MKYSVLVVDDDLSSRKEHYIAFEKKVSELQPGFAISLDYVEHPNHVRLMMQDKTYSAAIVDAVLDGNWECYKYNITNALKDIGKDLPIAIISDRWDKTNSAQIDEAWKLPNCRTFLHWRDIDPSRNGQIDYAVRALVSMIADHKNVDTQIHLDPKDPIRILHISDVQTGGFDDKTLKLEANRCADAILEHSDNLPPTFVAFTGDVAEYASPSQYESAHEWISYFFNRLKLGSLPARNVFYVPGNHDVNLNLVAASRVKLTNENYKLVMELSDEIQHVDLLGYAYRPFRNFLAKISDCPLLTQDTKNQDLAWVEARYRHLGIVFYGLNTAQPVNAFGLPDRRVNPDALALIGDNLRQITSDCGDHPPLFVGLSHHCPLPASDDSAVSNPEDFNKFFLGSTKTALFLHGHTHKHELEFLSGGGLRIVRSCAATLTKPSSARPGDTLRGFNILQLKRDDSIVKSLCASSFSWVGNDIQEIQRDSWELDSDGMFWPLRKTRKP